MLRFVLLLTLAVLLTACGGDSLTAPTAPVPTAFGATTPIKPKLGDRPPVAGFDSVGWRYVQHR